MKKKSESKSGTKSKTPAKRNSASKTKNSHDFLVVGIGASAGGVKALQEFFSLMPPNSGMAFVVILHLSPEHESNLGEIIQATTAMKVTTVTKTEHVEPNNVYVIPPNRQLEMTDGVVRCTKLNDSTGKRVAIDTFFRTLAEEYERNAVCIVLSGTGTDGTLGLKRIKESNGFAIVQEPSDAEYNQMPRSAIATQIADWVLPVQKMPQKLIEFRDSSNRLHMTDDDDGKVAREIQADESLREILTLLRVRTGHDFSNYKTPTLVRRIARHLQIHNLEDIPAYLEYLRRKPEEIQSLLKNLLINVTNFFRDKEAWDALESEVIPSLFAGKKSNDMVRVWSVGCASGEEAYSLAILLNEYAYELHEPPKLQIFATDVDDEAISEARNHRYPQSIEADVSEERLKRYFTKEGSYYRLKKEIRETVLFAPHNVLRDPPFSRLDLIVCRNLLIYLNRPTQERVMEIFHFALNPHMYLFLGSSESAESTPELFTTLNKKHRIYTRRPTPVAQTMPLRMPVVGKWQVNIPELAKKRNEQAFALGEVHYKLLEKFAPPSVLVNSSFDILYLSENAGRYLKFKGGAMPNNLLKLIHPDLLPDLRAALFNAQRERTIAEFNHIRCVINGEETEVSITVRAVAVENEAGDFLLVIFDEKGGAASAKEKKVEKTSQTSVKDEARETVVRRLEDELDRTKSHLRATIEQHEISVEELKASNEELQAINEELRSASEELETSKEELQSVNEELTTVNHELKEKIDELSHANTDLQNLMASTEIATIFLDRQLKIKRYTPRATEIFNIIPGDVGRPLSHVTHTLEPHSFEEKAEKVLETLQTTESEIRSRDGRFYLTRFAPYRTLEDKIEGVVMSFIDITERKQAEEELNRTTQLLQATFDNSLLIIQLFKAVRDESGEIVDFEWLMTNKQWNERWGEMTGKRLLTENPAVVETGLFDQFKQVTETGVPVTQEHYYKHEQFDGWFFQTVSKVEDGFLLSTLDITERKRQEEALRASEEKYRTLFNSIDEGFCTIEVIFDEKNNPVDYLFTDVNPAFEPQTGIMNAVGKTMREIAPEHEDFWFETYGRIVLTGEPQRFAHEAAQLGHFYEGYAFRIGDASERRVGILFNDILERKRAVELLRESEEQFRRAIEDAPIPVIMHAEDGEVLQISSTWTELTGYTLEDKDVIQSWLTKAYGFGGERVRDAMEHSFAPQAGKPMRAVVFDITTRDGEHRTWSFSASAPGTLRDGRRFVVGMAEDITDRKQAEKEIAEAREYAESIVETLHEPLIVLNPDLTVKSVNPSFYEHFGVKPEETIGRKIYDLGNGQWDIPALRTLLEDVLPDSNIFNDYEVSHDFEDIGQRVMLLNARRLDHVQLILLGIRDITDRKKADETVQKSEEHLQLIMESTKDYAIITFDLDGRITRWNRGAEKIFGWTEEEAAGQMTHLIFTPEDRAEGVPEREIDRTLRTGKAEDERWHIRKDGSRFYASGMMQLLRNKELEGFVKIARDETQKLKAEKALREKEMLQQFVRTQEDERRRIARDIHDHLGQQLTALRLSLNNLKEMCDKGDFALKDKVTAQIAEVQKTGEQIDRDVDFLAWELRPASLGDLGLRLTLQNFVKEWSNYSGVKAEFHTSGLNNIQMADEIETNLYRIAQEALNNIHKHAKAKSVSVLLEKRKDKIALIIEDDGVGFNVDKKLKRPQGLGLVGMRERAQLLGGEFEIESSRGKGTTIFARVPVNNK